MGLGPPRAEPPPIPETRSRQEGSVGKFSRWMGPPRWAPPLTKLEVLGPALEIQPEPLRSPHPNLSPGPGRLTPCSAAQPAAGGSKAGSLRGRPVARTRGLAPQPGASPSLTLGSRAPDPGERVRLSASQLTGQKAGPQEQQEQRQRRRRRRPGAPELHGALSGLRLRAAPGSAAPPLRGPRAPNFTARAAAARPPARLGGWSRGARWRQRRGGSARLRAPQRGPTRTCRLQPAGRGRGGGGGDREGKGGGGRRAEGTWRPRLANFPGPLWSRWGPRGITACSWGSQRWTPTLVNHLTPTTNSLKLGASICVPHRSG